MSELSNSTLFVRRAVVFDNDGGNRLGRSTEQSTTTQSLDRRLRYFCCFWSRPTRIEVATYTFFAPRVYHLEGTTGKLMQISGWPEKVEELGDALRVLSMLSFCIVQSKQSSSTLHHQRFDQRFELKGMMRWVEEKQKERR
jgi:hypothetical protein